MKRAYLLIFSLIICLGFNHINDDTAANNDANKIATMCENPESLYFWTRDTIIQTNSRLVSLMDSLYQYSRKNIITNDIQTNRRWMQDFRNQLCSYYIETRQSDTIPKFAMADSIIDEARALWNLDNDGSTMGTFIRNDVEHILLGFIQFNEFEKLNSLCETEEQRDMLLAEFAEWIDLEKLFYTIFTNCIDLHFWGGSIKGPQSTSGAIEILQAHIDLYRKEYLILDGAIDWSDYGTFIKAAQNLLNNCCEQALDEYYNLDVIDIKYKELYNNTKSLINKLPERIDAWCKSRQPWEKESSTDWLRPEYSRHTSEVLMKLAHIISSVQ